MMPKWSGEARSCQSRLAGVRRAALCGVFLWLAASALAAAADGGTATVREYRKSIRTYPFSDPNAIAAPGRIYPYFRFDGYTNEPVDREWTVIELENAYLKVTVLPEIGGKIWSAVEKSTGRSFIYDNHVVKFRDISMRGPWTSGGIEANYGIIGHTPNVATPVDYETSVAADGSAVVVIGGLDLLTRTPWRLEVRLPADKAYFTTRSSWYNVTPLEQAYYSWMNAGIKAAGGLELIYPGTHYIGHEGEVSPWPIHPGNGKNLALYAQNDFGPSKSYHVLGRYSDFFGAYWHDDDFGMGRYSARDDKLGKKAWIWALSRQGQIWERLLTDADGQYVEVQSGRLFNQAAEGSTFTPFKHRGFEPYASDSWTEYWFPVKGTGGFVAANEHGALNVSATGNTPSRVTLRFSPLEAIDDTLEVLDGDRRVYSARLSLAPMQTWSASFDSPAAPGRLRVRIGERLDYRAQADDELSRPLEPPKGFDWQSVQGLHLAGKEWMRQREYARAQASLEQCLAKDPNYLPALADLSAVRYRAMDYREARDLARRGLAVDTYDPASNYYFALASAELGQLADAMDGYEVAASAPGWRSAAYTGLARLHVRTGDLAKAETYARRSLEGNALNLEAKHLAALVARLRGGSAAHDLEAILATMDPLDPFCRFERYLAAGGDASRRSFLAAIRGELPHETFLELAIWYHGLGRVDEARQVLALAPPQGEVLYWLAYLQRTRKQDAAAGRVAAGEDLLHKAASASPRLVFPFRSESAPVFEWAIRQSSAWQPKYYLALILWSRGKVDGARALLEQCGDAPAFAPFYAARARVLEPVSRERALADLQRAAALDRDEWRFGRLIAEHYLDGRQYDRALEIAGEYHRRFPRNYILGMLHAKALLRAGDAAEAAETLAHLEVLPYEGATEGRALHREAQLLLAARAWKAGRLPEALRSIAAAREWPEHLGAGKPYPAETDERLEDALEAVCRGKSTIQSITAASPTEARLLAAWQ